MTTYLITGGSGFIGSHVCERLLCDGHTVINIDNHNSFYDPQIKASNIREAQTHPNYTVYIDDIRNINKVTEIINRHKVKQIVHLAAMAGVRPSIEDPALYYDVNINGTAAILAAAKETHIERLLFASSSSVYGNNTKTPFSETDHVDHPISPYAASKKAGELLCYTSHHLYQLPIACLRFFTVYGPRQRPEMAIHKFTDLISKDHPIQLYNNGECQRDYTYIDDIIDGITKILDAPTLGYDIINLGESQTISTNDLVKELEHLLNKTAQIDRIPAQPGDVEITYADITHAKTQYHYNPTYTIQNGLSQFVDWYQQKNVHQSNLSATTH